MGDFELVRRVYVYTFNTITTVAITNEAEGIQVKFLGTFRRSFN